MSASPIPPMHRRATSRARLALHTLVALAVIAAGCAAPDAADDGADELATTGEADSAMSSAAPGEWIPLFDGTGLDRWRGYQRDDVPAGWRVEDGLLAFVPGSEGGDLITREQFDDFELELEWRISPGGNSGIFYRAGEDAESIWHDAPEMQILDDDAHVDGGSPLTSSGANYAINPPARDLVRPVGEWNRVRIVADGPRIEHWLNGERIVEYEVGSDDWERRVAASKFSEYPNYGRLTSGHIGLQDHGDRVWFRNIRIRPLSGGGSQ